MNRRILLVGGGGHCKSVLDTLLKLDNYSDVAIIDKSYNIGKKILGIQVIGSDDDLTKLFFEGYEYAFVTIGSIGDPKQRINLFNKLNKIGYKLPNIIDPSATISDYVNLDSGIFIGKNAVVNAESIIYKGAIINTGAIIEHDCLIKSFAHIASGVVLCGEVLIGEKSHIGANCVIKQQVKIGANSIIGMGSVVVNDIQENMIAYGNPCKEVRSR